MGCLRRKRPTTRAIPDIRLLDGLDDHLQRIKDLKNRIWRAISRALGAKNIRSMARTVNSWFRKRVHVRRRGQRKPDAETAAPVPDRALDVSPEPVADRLADLGSELPPYVNFDKLTDAVLAGTGMFAGFDEHDKHDEVNSNSKGKGEEDINEIIDKILKSDDDERPWDRPPKKPKKVRFKIQDELDQLDDTLTEALKLNMRIKHNDRQLRKRQLTRPQSILVRSTAPGAESLSPRDNAGGDITVQNAQNPPLPNWPDSEDELEEAIDVIFRNMGDGPQV